MPFYNMEELWGYYAMRSKSDRERHIIYNLSMELILKSIHRYREKIVIARGGDWRYSKMGEDNQKLHTSS